MTADVSSAATHKDAPCFWLYSSGSTGQPKACVHLQHDMRVCAETYARSVLQIGPADRCFSVAKLFFAYGLGNAMYFPLAVGATAILHPGPVTPPVVYALIERYRPTLFFSVPTHYAMLLAHQAEREFDLSSIRCAVSAGESLPPSVFERFRERFGIEILDGIGSTEILHIFISNLPGEPAPDRAAWSSPVTRHASSMKRGVPCPWATWENCWCAATRRALFTGTDTSRPRTRSTATGSGPETSIGRMRTASSGLPADPTTCSRSVESGSVPTEVEHALLEHPAVQACGVTGREDRDGLIKPVAHVVLETGGPRGPSSRRSCSSSPASVSLNTSVPVGSNS